MKKIILIGFLLIPFIGQSQIKLYRGLNSGISKAQAEELLKNDNHIFDGEFGIYESLIYTNRVNFNLMHNSDSQLYGISFWTKMKYTNSQYSANIPKVVEDFNNVIKEIHGKAQITKKIPSPSEIPINSSYKVKDWWDGRKSINIDLEKRRNVYDEMEYFVRLSIIDNSLAPTFDNESDF